MLILLFVGCGIEESQQVVEQDPNAGLIAQQEKSPEPEAIISALQILVNTEDHLKGEYTTEDGRVVEFEAKLGLERPDVFEESIVSVYEIDACFRSSTGEPFFCAAGGHGFYNPSWEISPDENIEDVSTEERMADFAIAYAIASDLECIQSNNNLLADGLIALGQSIPEAAFDYRAYMDDADKTGALEQSSEAFIYKSNPAYLQVLEIHEGPILDGLAHHSATRVLVYHGSTYALVSSYRSNNHGRGAGDSGMGRKCSRVFSFNSSWIPLSGNCATSPYGWGSTTGNACCNTAYGIHVCNDDSRLQRDIMIRASSGTNTQYYDWYVLYCGNDYYIPPHAPNCW
ncbi:hypothetical protein KKG22_02800 [Patescibacteria group bacterium]|nr:hypothetical protein [Patescibacteria group bacterium]